MGRPPLPDPPPGLFVVVAIYSPRPGDELALDAFGPFDDADLADMYADNIRGKVEPSGTVEHAIVRRVASVWMGP
jgi:hypothetical protein